MTVSLIILAALLVVGTVLYVHHRLTGADQAVEAANDNATTTDGECCGMHVVCEKDSLLAAVSSDIEYYDDEELDAYVGRGNSDYSDDEIEQFRDVLLTLLPEDIAGWARSLQLRNIELPAAVKDELLLIISERRLANYELRTTNYEAFANNYPSNN